MFNFIIITNIFNITNIIIILNNNNIIFINILIIIIVINSIFVLQLYVEER